MQKINETVKKETIYISAVTIALSGVMQAIFVLIGRWDYTVLLGNALSVVAAIGNFLLMGLTVQSALDMEAADAKKKMKASQTVRMLLLFCVAALGTALEIFNTITVIVPLFFPRIAAQIRPLFKKKNEKEI